ncbi:MAG: Methyltransferase domain protein [candidate division BRC1 bacterium ADurb.BinA364]|nr:MAG: Methyltransferase domain protein [candidate division BRC1 bacterium ADurb.BinA364]
MWDLTTGLGAGRNAFPLKRHAIVMRKDARTWIERWLRRLPSDAYVAALADSALAAAEAETLKRKYPQIKEIVEYDAARARTGDPRLKRQLASLKSLDSAMAPLAGPAPDFDSLYPTLVALRRAGVRQFAFHGPGGTMPARIEHVLAEFEGSHKGGQCLIVADARVLSPAEATRLNPRTTFALGPSQIQLGRWGFAAAYWIESDAGRFAENALEYEDTLPGATIKFVPPSALPHAPLENLCLIHPESDWPGFAAAAPAPMREIALAARIAESMGFESILVAGAGDSPDFSWADGLRARVAAVGGESLAEEAAKTENASGAPEPDLAEEAAKPPAAVSSFEEMRANYHYRALLGIGEPVQPREWEAILGDAKLARLLAALAERGLAPDGYRACPPSGAFPALTRDPLYAKALAAHGEALSPADLDAIANDEALFLALSVLETPSFLEALGAKHSIPTEFARAILRFDLELMRRSLAGRPDGMHFSLFSKYAANHMISCGVNHRVIGALAKELRGKRGVFFDVGCAFGFSMLSALSHGFAVAHGCDLNKNIHAFGESLAEFADALGGEYRHFLGDFVELDLPHGACDLIMVNNVLEHTPDLPATIRAIAERLAPDGVCYIFQNSYPSIFYVRHEPHCGLPGLMVFPRELAARLAERANLIASPERYWVKQWPSYGELAELLHRHGLDAEWRDDLCEDRRTERETFDDAMRRRRSIDADLEAKLFPLMNAGERDEARRHIDAYFRGLQIAWEKDKNMAARTYLTKNWNLLVRKRR